MKILFVTPSYKPAYLYGGPAISVSELAEALVSNGNTVTVYTTTANGSSELDVPVDQPVNVNGVTVYYCKRITGDHTHISPQLWRRLWKSCHSFDIVNLQSWWSILILGAAFICNKKKVPYVISPRGMLSSYSFQAHHSFPKLVLHRMVGKRLLKKGLLHATTRLEWEDCAQIYASWKGFILPNLINLPSPNLLPVTRKANHTLTLGFLSRIDPKKGIELLFNALSKVNFDFRLLIAGKGSDDYITSLKTLSSNLGIDHKVEWCGWKEGEEKFFFMQSIDLFVLTSYNENFAIAVTEALAMGTPVLVSNKVGLADYVKENDFGWVCETNTASIRDTLQSIYTEKIKLQQIKQTAPGIIQKDYQKNIMAEKYQKAYKQAVTFF